MMGFIQLPLVNAFRLIVRRPSLPSQLKNTKGNAISHLRTQIGSLSTAADVAEFEPDELINDGKEMEKDTTLQLALRRLEGDFSKESMLSLSRFFRSRRASVVSTGSLKLDLALGIGGLPKGRMVEIYGQEASGKTTLAFHIIKEAQKLGGYCAYLDAENAMDPGLLESMKVNAGNLLIASPDSAENMLCMVDTLAKSGSVDVIVVDSVAALTPQFEIDAPLGSTELHLQSQIMTKALRKIHHSLCRSKTLIVFLNQVRSKGVGRKDEVTCGGNGLKFYAAVRLRISRLKLLKMGDQFGGIKICVEVVKNKLAPVMKKAELDLQFGRGIHRESEALELALEHGIVLKEGSSYFIEGKVLEGESAARRYLVENGEILDKIIQDLRSQLFQTSRN